MAQDKTYNEQTGQYEDIPGNDKEVTNPNGVGTGTGTAPPKSYNPFDRTTFRDDWMANGAGYGGDVNKFIGDKGLDPSQFQSVGTNNGAWRLPTGEVMDLVGDKGGKNSAEWTGAGYSTTPGGPIQQYAGAPTGPSIAGAVAGAGTPSTGASSGLHDQLLQQLMARAKQGTNVDPNDPIIKGQTDAFTAAQERSRRQYLSGVAEKAGPNANLNAETRATAEKVGQTTGGFQSELMGRELTSRRQEIQDALSSMQGMLSTDEQLALQRELAQMDDAIKRLGLSQNNSQFYSAQGNNNDQFLARLGLDTGHESWYQDAVNKGLIQG